MFTTTKIESTIRPQKFESLNNGIWYYNYDIVEKLVITRDMNDEEDREELRYEFLQVRINGNPTLQKCYEAILKSYVDENNTSLYDIIKLGETNYLADEIYFNIKVDFGIKKEISQLDKAKKLLISKINEYDLSSNINSFFLNGKQAWLNKDTRVGLMNSLQIEKKSGKEKSVLWLENLKFEINIDKAVQMLSLLELYALTCYNCTAEHKRSVLDLETIEEVNSYDYTINYPIKLEFNL